MRKGSADLEEQLSPKRNTVDQYIKALESKDKMVKFSISDFFRAILFSKGLQNRTLDEVLALVDNRKQTLVAEIQQLSSLKSLIQLCNKYACRLLKQGKYLF